MPTLYKFEKLHKYLHDNEFPEVGNTSRPVIIRGIDFKKAVQDGKVQYQEDGIHIDDTRVYVHQESYQDQYLRDGKTPKIHIVKCEIMNNPRIKNFTASNDKKHDIKNRDTGEIYKGLKLLVCRYCQEKLKVDGHYDLADIKDTEDFYDALFDKSQPQEKEVAVDIHGYPFNFRRISKRYKKSKAYTCEQCYIKPNKFHHRKYWHVHHIDGKKTNNETSNLECLCIRCHAKIDDHHKGMINESDLKKFNNLYTGF